MAMIKFEWEKCERENEWTNEHVQIITCHDFLRKHS